MSPSTSQEQEPLRLYSVLIDRGGYEKEGIIYFADHVYAKDDADALQKVRALNGGRHTQFYSKDAKRHINVYEDTDAK